MALITVYECEPYDRKHNKKVSRKLRRRKNGYKKVKKGFNDIVDVDADDAIVDVDIDNRFIEKGII